MHTLLHMALLLLADPSNIPSPTKGSSVPSPPDNTVKVAIIGAIGLVLATTVTAVASTFKKDKDRPAPGTDASRRYIAALEKDRREYGKLREEHAHLREACLRRQLDPDALIREQGGTT